MSSSRWGYPTPTTTSPSCWSIASTTIRREQVLDWTRAGGTLVVTDPESSLTPPVFGAPPADDSALGRGICTIDSLDGVEEVDGGFAQRYDTGGSHSSCLGSLDFAFVAARSEGAGEVVSIGGADFATNQRLDHDDNAVLAAALLAPGRGTSVRFVDAPLPAGGGDKTLGDLVSDGVRRLGWQLAIAFLVYAAWRARPARPARAGDAAGRDRRVRAGRGRRSSPRARPVRPGRPRRCCAHGCGAPCRPASASRRVPRLPRSPRWSPSAPAPMPR